MNSITGIAIYFGVLLLFLLVFRKKLVVNKFLKIFYLALIRTKLGLSLMNKIAKKFPKTLFYTNYFSIFLGFVGMFYVSYDILNGFYNLFSKSSAVTVSLVLPFKLNGAFYVPFAYWIISVIIVMIVHEFSHGIFARHNKIKVKASGFAVLGAILPFVPGAFVDIDEKTMSKKSLRAQLGVLSAAPFANMLTGTLFLIFMLATSQIISSTHINDGVLITEVANNSPAKINGFSKGDVIRNINGVTILTVDDFVKSFEGKNPNDSININEKKVILASNPDSSKSPYFGVFVDQNIVLKNEYSNHLVLAKILLWVKELFFWLFAINIGVGAFNLLPLGLLDGGRMFKIIICKFLKHRHANKIVTTLNFTLAAVILVSIFNSFVG